MKVSHVVSRTVIVDRIVRQKAVVIVICNPFLSLTPTALALFLENCTHVFADETPGISMGNFCASVRVKQASSRVVDVR